MITIEALKEQVIAFIDSKLTQIAESSTSGKLFKPIISVIVENNIDKADTILNLLADKDGNIDALSLITQYEDTLLNSKDVVSIGIVEVGGGKIKIDIPYFDKKITMDASDVEELKGLLTN